MHSTDTAQPAAPRRVRPFKQIGAAAALALATVVGLVACGSTPTASSAAGSATVSPAAATDAAAALRLRGPYPYEYLPKVPGFLLTSATVHNGAPLPQAQLSKLLGVPGGKDISPQLSWSGFPKATKSFVVSMYDPQAPTGSGFWHWVVIDIPGGTTSLPLDAGAANSDTLPTGAIQLADDAGVHQYVGGAPPAGSGAHDYSITVTALDVASTGLPATASPAYTGFAIDAHTIARATIVCPTAASH
ncbi:MAG TPA: YbhB/YbcL family Raf kinase inhibitor-like protein [Pseudonocardiaceae bacterium]